MGVGRCGCDVGGCGRWVQVMERVKIEGVEREGVWKRVSSYSHWYVTSINLVVLYKVLVKIRGRLQ